MHVYKDYAPVVGGIENHIRLLAERQACAGHEVTVLVTSRTMRTFVDLVSGVRVIKAARLAHVASTPLSAMLLLCLRRECPDITHLHFPYPVGEIAHLLFGRGRCAIMTYHSDIVRQATMLRFYQPLMYRVLAAVDRIVVSNPPLLQSSPVLSAFRHKCAVVPLGIDRSPFLLRRTDAIGALHERYGPGPWLLFVGVLRYYKGLQYLLQAMPHVPARLWIVGQGPMASELRAQAENLGLGDRVVFVGSVSDADLPVYYQAADLFVLPASERSEAFGLVQLEALSSGLPIVCTELGTGTTFVNQHGESGLVVPPKDPQALAAAINALLGDADLRLRLAEGARARSELFTVGRMVEAVLRLYEDVLAGQAPSNGDAGWSPV